MRLAFVVNDVATEIAHGCVHGPQRRTEEKGEVVPSGWSVGAEVDANEFAQCRGELVGLDLG